jgi:Fe-S-cluster-containing dehydrogenase component/CRP-like cAMP-binding protein
MDEPETIATTRPKRWAEPFDPQMRDEDVRWLRSIPPFNALDPYAFPKATPLEGILRNDCRFRAIQPGEVVVREGDYGNSAFLILSGELEAFLQRFRPERLGRASVAPMRWTESLRQWWRRSRWPEVRTAAQIHPQGGTTLRRINDAPRLFLQDFEGLLSTEQTLTLKGGELFGETAAMYRTPRTATVVATTESLLLEIRWQGLKLLKRDPKLKTQLDDHYRQQWLPVHLRETPLLARVPPNHLDAIVQAAQLKTYGKLEWYADYRRTKQLSAAQQIEAEPLIAHCGSLPTELILIRSGFARVCHPHGAGWQTLAYLGKGQLFGLAELIYNHQRPAGSEPMALVDALRAVGMVDAIQIPAHLVAEHLLPFIDHTSVAPPRKPIASLRSDGSYAEAIADHRPALPEDLPSELPTGLLEFVVQHRLNNGLQAMVIDLDRCTRCDDCVRACAATHDGNPRFVRQGPRWDNLQFAEACMHCADPVCMVGCPTGAIHRNQDTGVVAIDDPTCIGCGVCAASCPYENIRMAEVRDPQGRLWQDVETAQPIAKATKCDLCQRQPAGPACQSACAHDALVRIDLSDLAAMKQFLQRSSKAA